MDLGLSLAGLHTATAWVLRGSGDPLQGFLGGLQCRGESSPATAMAWSPIILAFQPKMSLLPARAILQQHCQGQEMPHTRQPPAASSPAPTPALLAPLPTTLPQPGGSRGNLGFPNGPPTLGPHHGLLQATLRYVPMPALRQDSPACTLQPAHQPG